MPYACDHEIYEVPGVYELTDIDKECLVWISLRGILSANSCWGQTKKLFNVLGATADWTELLEKYGVKYWGGYDLKLRRIDHDVFCTDTGIGLGLDDLIPLTVVIRESCNLNCNLSSANAEWVLSATTANRQRDLRPFFWDKESYNSIIQYAKGQLERGCSLPSLDINEPARMREFCQLADILFEIRYGKKYQLDTTLVSILTAGKKV